MPLTSLRNDLAGGGHSVPATGHTVQCTEEIIRQVIGRMIGEPELRGTPDGLL
jgi:hypothetical protein